MTKYQVVDIITKDFIGKPFKNRGQAMRRADALDLVYGAIKYSVQPVEVQS